MNEFLLVLAGGAVSLVTSATVTWLQGRYARRSETRLAARDATRQLTSLLIAQRDAPEGTPSTTVLAEAELLAATITTRRTREAVQEVIRLLRECELPELEQLSGVRAARARQILCDHGLAVLGAHLRGDRLPSVPETVRSMRSVENEALNIRAGGSPASSAATSLPPVPDVTSDPAPAGETPASDTPAVSSRKVRSRPRASRKSGATEPDPLD
ncbi:hypothetical protein NI17_018935 [Thermobifida halotolerans]|uniref:Uncharacterized protein n=1 Tax=Thermobifida halotolerans TaxID=483545 RepID=A0A399FWY0_9ACTN|nr:hypothetical protein [Thermobifida halotolerans]UOE18830.1 hypothetical protein NI17_018935 [Thermobifida halotolerans]